MTRLIIKIFLAYWLAAGLVIVAVNITPHEHMHIPELADALYASLDHDAQSALQRYHSEGCTADLQQPDKGGSRIGLASADGALLCGQLDEHGMHALITSAAHSGRVTVSSYRNFQVVALPVPEDKHYVFLLMSDYRSPLQFYGTLPGNITFEVSIVVTIVLALLVVLPVRRLRAMAHQIALGNLSARVSNGFFSPYIPFLGAGDDLDGMAIDFNFMANRIEALVNAQRLLLRDVSHELRSPLARMHLALQLAKSKCADAASIYLNRIELETEKLNDLISQLMDLSYMEMTNELAHPEEIELSLIVLDLLPDLQFEAAAKSCHVAASVTRTCRTRGDRTLLHRALENVARNAIRYTPTGGSVTIELNAEEKNGTKQAVLKVSDSGPGVPDCELRAIVKPFYRVDQARQSNSGGFGIGLAIADRTILLHNGELRVSNGSNGGLVVEMCLPAIAFGA